jgi:hypothetical protein
MHADTRRYSFAKPVCGHPAGQTCSQASKTPKNICVYLRASAVEFFFLYNIMIYVRFVSTFIHPIALP